MNKIFLSGNATKDPVLSKTNTGLSFCNFGIAVQRRFKNNDGEYETDFINCIAWRQTAEYITKYLKKGSKVIVTGSIQTRSYDATDGTKRYVTEVMVEDAEILNIQKQSDTTENNTQTNNIVNNGASKITGKNEDLRSFTPIDDDVLPF